MPLKDLKSGIPVDANSQNQDITDFVDGKIFECQKDKTSFYYLKFNKSKKEVNKIVVSSKRDILDFNWKNSQSLKFSIWYDNVIGRYLKLDRTPVSFPNLYLKINNELKLKRTYSNGDFNPNSTSITCKVLSLGQVDYSSMIKREVESKVNDWQRKDEFEKLADYRTRVNESTRKTAIQNFQEEFIKILAERYTSSLSLSNIEIGEYDSENETFLFKWPLVGDFVMKVPISEAKKVKELYLAKLNIKFLNPKFVLINNKFVLTHIDLKVFDLNAKFSYDISNKYNYTQTKIDYNFSAIEVDIPNQSLTQNNNIKQTNTISVGKADVDVNIPVNPYKNKNKYALVVGNEDYSSKQKTLSNEVDVEFARNDANSFKNYLVKALGFENDHVTLLKDATSGEMYRELEKLVSLAKLDSKSEIVFYYAGHGLPDNDKNPYLMPVDVSSINLKQNGIALKKLYFKLASSNASKITVFLDACFSGGGRDQGLLAARGVKIKPKEEVFIGNMLVFASSSGEEKSLPYEEKKHGMFTYFLLKKLKETNGNVSCGEISDYLRKEVSRKSLIEKNIQQTPHTNVSRTIDSNWKSWKLK